MQQQKEKLGGFQWPTKSPNTMQQLLPTSNASPSKAGAPGTRDNPYVVSDSEECASRPLECPRCLFLISL